MLICNANGQRETSGSDPRPLVVSALFRRFGFGMLLTRVEGPVRGCTS